jgi:hypothetical protein
VYIQTELRDIQKGGGGDSLQWYRLIMAIICYNGKFVTMAKSLETNVAVVTRADCIYTQFLRNLNDFENIDIASSVSRYISWDELSWYTDISVYFPIPNSFWFFCIFFFFIIIIFIFYFFETSKPLSMFCNTCIRFSILKNSQGKIS